MAGTDAGLSSGSVLEVVISDPWELSQIARGEIVDVHPASVDGDTESLLVRLNTPLSWKGHAYEFLALLGRYERVLIDRLAVGETVACNGVHVQPGAVGSPPPWGADGWRGGLAVIATVRTV